jgi:hypothetical protein
MKFAAEPALLAVILCAFSAGCTDPDLFDENTAKAAAEAQPVQLDSEQISLRDAELTCAVNNDLWDAPISVGGVVGTSGAGGERFLSHLQQKGRDLNFSDDVTSGESGFATPFTQVRGKFSLQLDRVVSIHDGEDKETKIVQAKVGVKIAHPCFANPLPIMGLRKGQYFDDLPVTLQYEKDTVGWHLAKIIH